MLRRNLKPFLTVAGWKMDSQGSNVLTADMKNCSHYHASVGGSAHRAVDAE
jgi:hypothetical protein